MSAAIQAPFVTDGPGWRLTLFDGYAYLGIHPEHGDLASAVATVLTPEQREHWTIEYAHDDPDGWYVWMLSRDY